MWQDFKKFAFKGNIVDLAVAVIIGGAFNKIVTSLVNDMLMPIIGVLLGGLGFDKLNIHFGTAVIKYGTFIQTVVDFFIVALTLFLIVRIYLRFKRKENAEQDSTPAPSNQEVLLTEIRDLLSQAVQPAASDESGAIGLNKRQE
ncbi:large-conductance mechanosensitive channel protein MscL [Pullulanibacillus sp. KACC 23026]|uniref:large-conductance mechanosensitive channel protein MscL n=1 Tax=Pullulanibacillus sp. KACC 23026 TaxID=3028315 RepID=UPI0023AE960C|nr:large-conductance mechanosensitive channel protein MscL [Pullulanibacillus sp. KACC 23026]WEG12960.1 large-conductance mechanosensitive channel protein MscL [Pullulanibacillus sp. KACC 23026]